MLFAPKLAWSFIKNNSLLRKWRIKKKQSYGFLIKSIAKQRDHITFTNDGNIICKNVNNAQNNNYNSKNNYCNDNNGQTTIVTLTKVIILKFEINTKSNVCNNNMSNSNRNSSNVLTRGSNSFNNGNNTTNNKVCNNVLRSKLKK